jgi:omega-6 fatty acid desaturase (delta-12 desaturase)
MERIIIMTQLSHIEIPVSNGEEVKPISYLKQVTYTRSFYIAQFIARYFLFHFNLHEAHHAYPGVPAYLLIK